MSWKWKQHGRYLLELWRRNTIDCRAFFQKSWYPESHWNHVFFNSENDKCHGFGTSATELQTSRKMNPRSFPDAMSSWGLWLSGVVLKQRKQENHRDCSGDETKVSLGSSKLVETSFGSWMLMVICWWGVDLMLYHVDDIDVSNSRMQANKPWSDTRWD